MSFKQPKVVMPAAQAPPPTPNLAAAESRIAGDRRRRVTQGGRNATFIASLINDVGTRASAGPAKTLTGLNG